MTPGATLFDRSPAVLMRRDFTGNCRLSHGAEYTGEELDSDTWQAELRLEVFLPA